MSGRCGVLRAPPRTRAFAPAPAPAPARFITAILAPTLALVLLAPQVRAQAPPDAGSIQRQQTPPILPPPSPAPPGVQVAPTPAPAAHASSKLRFTLTGFRISGETVFPERELLALVQDMVGTSVGFAELEQATQRLSRYYRQHGYVVARAYLPEQELSDGMVQVTVLEGRIGRVIIDNHSRVRDALIAARVDGLQGRIVREQDIDARLRLVYDLTGSAAGPAAALKAGDQVGDADLVLQPVATPLLDGYVALDNYGNRYTGGDQLSGQLDINSPTRSGDLLSLQGALGLQGKPSEPDLGTYKASYQIPASPTGLLLGADYSHVHYRLGREFEALDANGTANTWLAFASHPLLLGQTWSTHARISYQQSTLQDRIESTATVTDKSSRLGSIALTGDWQDSFAGGGANALSASYSLGDLRIESPDALAIDAATARTQGRFEICNLNATRLQRLSEQFALNLAIAWQQADKNLDSSQKLIVGGPYGVKDYPEGEAPGDSGYLIDAELRYDVISAWIPGHLQLLGLADTARVRTNEDEFEPGSNHRELSSAGLGFSWLAVYGLQLRLMAAHKLGDARATSDTDRETRVWLQLLDRF